MPLSSLGDSRHSTHTLVTTSLANAAVAAACGRQRDVAVGRQREGRRRVSESLSDDDPDAAAVEGWIHLPSGRLADLDPRTPASGATDLTHVEDAERAIARAQRRIPTLGCGR